MAAANDGEPSPTPTPATSSAAEQVIVPPGAGTTSPCLIPNRVTLAKHHRDGFGHSLTLGEFLSHFSSSILALR
jgi:hypothetical protein